MVCLFFVFFITIRLLVGCRVVTLWVSLAKCDLNNDQRLGNLFSKVNLEPTHVWLHQRVLKGHFFFLSSGTFILFLILYLDTLDLPCFCNFRFRMFFRDKMHKMYLPIILKYNTGLWIVISVSWNVKLVFFKCDICFWNVILHKQIGQNRKF